MQAMSILAKAPALRSETELEFLFAYFNDVAFFRGLDAANVRKCFSRVVIEHYRRGQAVCNYGEMGSTFHIVIKGRLGVKVPTPFEQKMTLVSFKQFVGENKRDIVSEQPQNPVAVARAGEIGYSPAETEELHSIRLKLLREVANIGEGGSFGELSLLTMAPRAATVYCKEDCDIATLQKGDFDECFGTHFQAEFERKIEFLRRFSIFRSLGRKAIMRFIYYISEKRLKRGQTLYEEGDTPDGVYFLKEGEVEFTKGMVIEEEGLDAAEQEKRGIDPPLIDLNKIRK